MGNFYTNITVLGPDRLALRDWLRDQRRAAYLSPTWHGFTVVHDRECDESFDPEELTDLAARLSAYFKCTALAALDADDDVLGLWLVENGESRFAYDSTAWRRQGAATLCRVFHRPLAFPQVWLLLHLPYVLFEHLRHRWLMQALGMPAAWAAGFGYRYLDQGDPAPEDLWGDAVHTRDDDE